MNIDQLRKLCLAFPGVTEQIQWGDDLLFKVGGKMFVVTRLEPAKVWLSLKANPEKFAELTERPGVIPAPYLARAKWISLETPEALPPVEIAELVRESYELVLAKLPRKLRESVANEPALKARARKKPFGKPKTRK
ncbi:MAG TPA: MmcQ/YjbR family DNA-binding protein [Candidatus Sulfotelmatobacter sp.]|jgi:predicted DNA-binding protein (MmcQ/YjbR family)|nr:MmcQ/YjbR family DNA-binding protein [Candidatus Sulfotelmatobacter sp.]